MSEALTCYDIQRALFLHHDKGGAVICFNSTRALAHEADVLVLRKTGVSLEYEVKVSRADFRADFRKLLKHRQLSKGNRQGPQHFSYACEPGLIGLDDLPDYCGLVHISRGRAYPGELIVTVLRAAPRLHKFEHVGIHERICRSLMYQALYRSSHVVPKTPPR